MISPPRPDGPPVRFGKPYSAIAQLAEDIDALRRHGAGPARRAASPRRRSGGATRHGLAPPRGSRRRAGVVDADGPIAERYAAAVDVLAALHARDLPATCRSATRVDHTHPALRPRRAPDRGRAADRLVCCRICAARRRRGRRAPSFVALWRDALGRSSRAPRDLDAARLPFAQPASGCPSATGLAARPPRLPGRRDRARRPMTSPRCCRTRASPCRRSSRCSCSRTTSARAKAADPASTSAPSPRAYAIMGAQRATKILGIFARLDRRDGKPHYLAHLPRAQEIFDAEFDASGLARSTRPGL